MIREITVPSVIVECGFLSNSVEHDLLQSDKYQSKLAWAIYMGILDYYGESKVWYIIKISLSNKNILY